MSSYFPKLAAGGDAKSFLLNLDAHANYAMYQLDSEGKAINMVAGERLESMFINVLRSVAPVAGVVTLSETNIIGYLSNWRTTLFASLVQVLNLPLGQCRAHEREIKCRFNVLSQFLNLGAYIDYAPKTGDYIIGEKGKALDAIKEAAKS